MNEDEVIEEPIIDDHIPYRQTFPDFQSKELADRMYSFPASSSERYNAAAEYFTYLRFRVDWNSSVPTIYYINDVSDTGENTETINHALHGTR